MLARKGRNTNVAERICDWFPLSRRISPLVMPRREFLVSGLEGEISRRSGSRQFKKLFEVVKVAIGAGVAPTCLALAQCAVRAGMHECTELN